MIGSMGGGMGSIGSDRVNGEWLRGQRTTDPNHPIEPTKTHEKQHHSDFLSFVFPIKKKKRKKRQKGLKRQKGSRYQHRESESSL